MTQYQAQVEFTSDPELCSSSSTSQILGSSPEMSPSSLASDILLKLM